MNNKPKTPSQKAEADQRAKRRSEQLRANLMRRKLQIRSRRSEAEEECGEGLSVANSSGVSGELSDPLADRENDAD